MNSPILKLLLVLFPLLATVAQEPQNEAQSFILTTNNAQRMTPHNDPANERWTDIAGNHYSTQFCRRFSYEATGDNAPQVLIRVDDQGSTLTGRLEARNLKPNFAYQIKLMGDYARDPNGWAAIGRLGRWRLPGPGTNFSDAEAVAYPDKNQVEAYILFDYFVTDKDGNAIHTFSLSKSLHVLFNNGSQVRCREGGAVMDRSVTVDASSDRIYSRPKSQPTTETLVAEAELTRPLSRHSHLHSGSYKAVLVLTEESFHDYGDGGYWAAAYTCPVTFNIAR